jgi:hypothetical protein
VEARRIQTGRLDVDREPHYISIRLLAIDEPESPFGQERQPSYTHLRCSPIVSNNFHSDRPRSEIRTRTAKIAPMFLHPCNTSPPCRIFM